MAELEVLTTDDGSKTLYSSELDEIYHSRRGALAESRHVFIEHGMATMAKDTIKVLEVGFGTGLNLILAKRFCDLNKKRLGYTGLEPYPLGRDVLLQCREPELKRFGIMDWLIQHLRSLK